MVICCKRTCHRREARHRLQQCVDKRARRHVRHALGCHKNAVSQRGKVVVHQPLEDGVLLNHHQVPGEQSTATSCLLV